MGRAPQLCGLRLPSGRGGPLSAGGGALPQLFETIAQRHGKRGFQVRKGMANVAKYLRTTAMGQAWRREQGRLLSHWDVIFLLWGAVGKGQL